MRNRIEIRCVEFLGWGGTRREVRFTAEGPARVLCTTTAATSQPGAAALAIASAAGLAENPVGHVAFARLATCTGMQPFEDEQRDACVLFGNV